MSYRLTRRGWLAYSTLAMMSCKAIRSIDAVETTVAWSAAAIRCNTLAFRDQVGTGVVLTAMAASPSGPWLAAAGEDHKIRIVHTVDLTTHQTLTGHRDRIRSLAFDAEGRRLASAGNDGQVLIYDCSSDYQIVHRVSEKPSLAGLAFATHSQHLAVVGFSNRVFLVESNGDVGREIDCDCRDLRAVAWRDDGGVLALGGQGGQLLLLDPRDGRSIAKVPLHGGKIHDLAFHRQSNVVVSIGDDGMATVYDTENQRLLRRVSVTSGRLFSLAVLNSQSVAVAGSDNLIRILNTDDGLVVRALEGHVGSVAGLASVGNSLFSAGFDATLKRWSIEVGTDQTERIAESDPSIDR